jgi:uncharacterized protein (DUF2252 family)
MNATQATHTAMTPGATPSERAAIGKAARAHSPRADHGDWEPAADRLSPVDVLEKEDADRVPELVPLRHERMLVSAFTFFRGAAAIMAGDLNATPNSGLWVQACGDAHLSNFGAYASPSRDLVVDINDFDETAPGPWEWDLKRLAASFEIGARDRGFDEAERRAAVLASARAYREAMRELAGLGNLEIWYRQVDTTEIRAAFAPAASKHERKAFDRMVAKAVGKDRLRAFSKLTHVVDGELRIASDPPVLVPLEELASGEQLKDSEARLGEVIAGYRETLDSARQHLFDRYTFVHLARKVVGVGSVGTRAWVALFVGRDDGDPLFLQVKEAQPSVLEPYTAPCEFGHEGERVVKGQRLTQATSDILLGWVKAQGPDAGNVERDFYVRQLWDQKGSVVVETIEPQGMRDYAQICGGILARAHARSGDPIAISAYLGKGDSFDEAIARFAVAYADQNERDFAELEAAVGAGRFTVEHEPA